jgi:nitrite reductase (NO-forming)
MDATQGSGSTPPRPPSGSLRAGRFEWWLTPLIGGLAVLALVVATIAVLAASSPEVGASGGATSSGAGSASTDFDVVLADFSITPASIEVPAGETLTFHVTNEGEMPHDFAVDGADGTKMLDPGESETIEVDGVTAATDAWCTVAGHRESGMEMSISLAGTGDSVSGDSDDGHAAAAVAIDADAERPPDWQPYDPELAPAPGGTEHEITLRATEETMEIAPGVEQEMWTFGGTVPGPPLRGKVGDVFTVTLVNDGNVGHSIDFHASQVAMDEKMRTLEPGESLVYQFKAKHAGIWMYHCGTAPVLHHIGNGMYGAVVIDPADLAPVDHEYLFVQSELYLGEDGGVGSLDAMLAEQWDGVAFNGNAFQYKSEPITSALPGDRVRIWVLDAGPSENSAFHIVGTQFDTVYKEGAYLLRPETSRGGGSQTLDLQPSQGGFVELTFPEDGTYAMVTHKFASASKGALGLWHVGDVPDGGGTGH